MFRLYREPEPKELTVIGADPADGGSDSCAAVAKSRKMNDSFLVFQQRMDSSQFGHELFKMAKYIYNKTGEYPVIAVERNVGMATISVLQMHNYPRLFRMPQIGDIDKDISDRIGWYTNSGTRPKMLDDFSLSLKQQANRIYDEPTIDELLAFIRNARSGKPEAAAGHHDDLLMAEAIAWQVIQLSPAASKESAMARIAQFPRQQLFDDSGLPNY